MPETQKGRAARREERPAALCRQQRRSAGSRRGCVSRPALEALLELKIERKKVYEETIMFLCPRWGIGLFSVPVCHGKDGLR